MQVGLQMVFQSHGYGPSVSDGQIFIRTDKALYAIGRRRDD